MDLAHADAAVQAQSVDYYLRLLDIAAALDEPIVCCRGYVGRLRAISTQVEEGAVFVDAVRRVAERAQTMNLRMAMAALNEIAYSRPIILVCTAPGPDPFTAIKTENSLSWLETYLAESRKWLLGARK